MNERCRPEPEVYNSDHARLGIVGYGDAITAPKRHLSVTESVALPPRLREQSMSSKKLSLEQKWHEQAEAFKREAATLPYGKEREDRLRTARQLETASHINEWLSSSELQPPK
jgi:hypothetical protein